MHGSSWKIVKQAKRPLQPTDDGHSCGPLVLHYVDCIGSYKQFDMNLNIRQYRNIVAKELLLRSQNMKNVCLHCGKNVLQIGYRCQSCYRKTHEDCAFYSELDTDNVTDAYEITELRNNTKIIHPFICRLCKINKK